MTELLTAGLVLLGAGFATIAGLGLLRLPDVYVRMHASTKAGTLGAGLILIAAAVHFADGETVARALLTALFLFLTAPIAAHLLARAAYRTGTPLSERSLVDEWAAEPGGKRRGRPERHAPPADETAGPRVVDTSDPPA